MTLRTTRRTSTLVATTLSLTLLATACGGSDDSAAGGDLPAEGCDSFADYTGNEGTEVSIYASIVDIEGERLQNAWADFASCTGIDISYEASSEFEAQLQVRVQGGNAPDLAFLPQPGLLRTFATDGDLVPAGDAATAMAEDNYPEDWLGYGTVDGEFYAPPLSANVKSFVWYSPSAFTEAGYEIPETWDDMVTLSEQIVSDGGTPWCAGVESGDATGWPTTDWLEDAMLREHGADVYDQWVDHEIPFDDPQVASALERVGGILKNGEFVNGGLGDVTSIVTTPFQDGGLPILDGNCSMHRQASFYANNWPEGTTVAQDGDVFAFYLPVVEEGGDRPILGGGEFVGAFDDRPEVAAVQTYLASADYNNRRAQEGAWISANRGLEIENVESPIDQLSLELIQDEATVFRFDGSDLMPAAVGAGSFWTGMVNWLTGTDDAATLEFVEASWPSS